MKWGWFFNCFPPLKDRANQTISFRLLNFGKTSFLGWDMVPWKMSKSLKSGDFLMDFSATLYFPSFHCFHFHYELFFTISFQTPLARHDSIIFFNIHSFSCFCFFSSVQLEISRKHFQGFKINCFLLKS